MFGTICHFLEGSVQLIKNILQLKKMLLFLVLVVAEVQFSPVQLWRSCFIMCRMFFGQGLTDSHHSFTAQFYSVFISPNFVMLLK